jgi:hypothetical protein
MLGHFYRSVLILLSLLLSYEILSSTLQMASDRIISRACRISGIHGLSDTS